MDADELGIQIGALIDGLAIQVLMDHGDVTPDDMLRVSREVSSKLIGFALEPATAIEPPRYPVRAMAPVPLLMDVDTGVDDALALLYAVASPEVDLIGATSVMGNISVEQATENTLAVLEAAGEADVEVAQGRPGRSPATTSRSRSSTGNEGSAGPPPTAGGQALDPLGGRADRRTARERDPARSSSSRPDRSRTSRSRSARSRTSHSSSAASR